MLLPSLTARELMTRGPLSVSAAATPDQAAAFLTGQGIGSAVVTDPAGRPVGVVTKTDLLVHTLEAAAAGRPAPATVRDVMTPTVFAVADDTPAREVVGQLLALNVHHLFVTDGTGAAVGVVTPTDILRKLE